LQAGFNFSLQKKINKKNKNGGKTLVESFSAVIFCVSMFLALQFVLSV
jgi:hypothetical protein